MDGERFLARHGLMGRFDASVEPAFKEWFIHRLRPLGIAMASASIVGWLFIPVLIVEYTGTAHVHAVYFVCWGLNIPALIAGILYMKRPEPKWAIGVGAALIALTAVDTIAVLLPWINGLEPATFALAATFYGLLAPATQFPFRPTLFAGLLITSAGWLGLDRASDSWSQNTVIGFSTIVFSTLVIGLAMAFANERDLRTRFANEQIIENQRQLIRRYAPSSVTSRIELGDDSVDHPQRRRITVFSSDVVGFTAMADRIDPESLAQIINEYLGAVSELIERHGGTVTEFAGDGVMAIFGAPDDLEPTDQVVAAIEAARELQASLAVWSLAWHQHGTIEQTNARIGINTGIVSVGTFGSAIRATYTGIGLQMNIAARVQAQAQPGGILLSNTSWHLIKDQVACEPRGEVMVKGVHFPIELYEPV
jgi:class 3 adenylate cyclase